MHIPSHSILSKTQSWFFIAHPSNADNPSVPYNLKFLHSFVAGISLCVYFWILFVIQETSLWGLQLRKFHSFLCHPHTVPPPTHTNAPSDSTVQSVAGLLARQQQSHSLHAKEDVGRELALQRWGPLTNFSCWEKISIQRCLSISIEFH